ncbi:MAG: hypothetical protein R2823_07295 [Acidimicrobiia bacterium]
MPEPIETDRGSNLWGSNDRIELIATVILAVATILTAWSAFQAGKWSGQQSINFSEAGAARTESTRHDTAGGQLSQIDVAMYIDWVAAVFDEMEAGTLVLDDASEYVPQRGTLSGFLYFRFRDEFKPAVQAWLATDPLNNTDSPSSPFVMDEYVVAERVEAQRLVGVADAKAAAARQSNQNGDNYVLTMVLFASVLFFAGVSSKIYKPRNRMIVVGIGATMLVVGVIVLLSLPILV